jgi:RNA polymerase sigma-70 factor (ECF subfamily)
VEDGGEERTFRRYQRDFDALFRAHYPEIVRFLAARLGSRDAAADVAGDVFVEAYKRAPLLRWRGKPMLAWLYRVAANMAADHVKRAAREIAVEQVPEVPTLDETQTLPEREAVARALRKLPDDYQLVVHLRLVEDYSFDDVARVMGRTVGACQMLMLRAGRALRQALEQEGVRARA